MSSIVGKKCPLIENLHFLKGDPIDFKTAFNGDQKIIVLFFWATNNRSSVDSIIKINDLQQKLKEKKRYISRVN